MARFTRTHPAPLVTGDYTAFRSYVRRDFEERCAYCLLAELYAGGPENFEIDHFRPVALFPHLRREFSNLYYACHPCNLVKGEKWPSLDLLEQGTGFVDLCVHEFDLHFRETPEGIWAPLASSASYTIHSMRLNRPHLVELRRLLGELDHH